MSLFPSIQLSAMLGIVSRLEQQLRGICSLCVDPLSAPDARRAVAWPLAQSPEFCCFLPTLPRFCGSQSDVTGKPAALPSAKITSCVDLDRFM